jgi:hypothetical protein
MSAETKPKVLFVYYTLSEQTGRVVHAMAEALAARAARSPKRWSSSPTQSGGNS